MNKESDFAHAMDRYEFMSGFATLLAATIRQVIPPWLGYLPVVFVLSRLLRHPFRAGTPSG
jgi:hypothetical protein